MVVVIALRLGPPGVRWWRGRSIQEPTWWPEFERDFRAYVRSSRRKLDHPGAKKPANPPKA
jgi:hypothetical protein